MRLVLDTNTALSGLLWGGTPGRLIDAAEATRVELLSSAALLAELQGVLMREKFVGQLARRGLSVADVFDGYAALVTLVTPAAIAPTIVRDPADDQVLAAALAARADAIVSGDAHLLDLKQFQGIPIVSTAEALLRIAASGEPGGTGKT
ncbi:putative toxin-antitoxin system toxin component, PIN family [Roseateles sp. LYH14W]|uniref:Toxin-antitoxin system toxin component, PIN family n=1 Tax=Pelomonas parva TaxID=3299032 RepID=A0ABW7F581_9BURK